MNFGKADHYQDTGILTKKWSPMVGLWPSKQEVSGLARKAPPQRVEKVKNTLPWDESLSISHPEKEPTGFT